MYVLPRIFRTTHGLNNPLIWGKVSLRQEFEQVEWIAKVDKSVGSPSSLPKEKISRSRIVSYEYWQMKFVVENTISIQWMNVLHPN